MFLLKQFASCAKDKLYRSYNVVYFYRDIFFVAASACSVCLVPYLCDSKTHCFDVASALFGIAIFLWQNRYQERQKQFLEIQSALASFENTRITLITFKGKFIFEGKEKIKNFLVSNGIEMEKDLIPLSDNQLDQWHKLTYKTSVILTFFEIQNFYTASFSEKLAFIAEKNPKELIFLHKAYETLHQINNMIENRNRELTKYRHSSDNEKEKIIKYIDTYHNILNNLNNLTDASLAFHRDSSDFLIKYAEMNYFVEKSRIFHKKFNTEYDYLMPTLLKI